MRLSHLILHTLTAVCVGLELRNINQYEGFSRVALGVNFRHVGRGLDRHNRHYKKDWERVYRLIWVNGTNGTQKRGIWSVSFILLLLTK